MSDMKKLLDSLTEMATVSGSVATVSAPLGATRTRSKSTGTASVYGEQVSETESAEKTDECDSDSDKQDGVTNNVRTPANFGLWQNSYHQAEEQKKQSKTKKTGAKKPVSEARVSDEMSELDKPEIQSAMKRMKAKYDSDPRTKDQEKFSRDLGRRLQAAASRSEKKSRPDEQLNDNRGPGGLRPLNLAEQNLDEADLIMNPFERSKKRPRGIFSKNTKQDHEVSMARSDLLQCIKNSEMVIDLLSSMSDSDNIEAWVQEKIVKANDYLNTVAEYLEGKRALGEGEDLAWDDPDLVMMRKMQADKKKKMAVVKPKDEIGFKVSDIGPGGREYNVKTDAAWDRKHGVKESVTDYNPKSQGGTRKELLAKLRSAKTAAERSDLATRARKAGATQRELQDLSEGDGQYGGQYATKDQAVAYAKEKVKSFRDPEDGIEIWAMPSGGFDVVHTMNSNGRNHVVKNGGKKLGTVGARYKGVAEGLGKDIKRLATGKDVNSRAGQEIAKSQDASMKGDTKTSKKHFDRYDKLDKLANKEQGVAEGSDDELNARPGMWRGDAKRMTAKGKPTKDELGMQDNLKNRIKASNKKGGLTGPKGVLPEQGVAEATGDGQFDTMMKTITKAPTAKERNAERIRQKAERQEDSRKRASDVFGTSPADKLSIRKTGVAEGEQRMSRAAKGNEKYGKDGMKALARAGREGASEKKLDTIRDKYDNYNESVAGPEKCWPGHRKVGTKPGTGKNAGKRVNDCEKIDEQGVAEGNDRSDIRPPRVGDEIILKNPNYRGVIVKLGTDGEFSFKNESDGKRYRGNAVMIDRNLSQENRYRERSDTDNKRFDDAMARDMERINKSGALKKFGIGEEIEGGVAEAFGENLPPLKSPNKDDPYEQGWRTFYRRGDESDNPYERDTPEYQQWNRGFQDGEAEPNHYDESVNVSEKGPGLWANIHAKRERIKKGSGERMRKPGSKGAPSNKDLSSTRNASKNESKELDAKTSSLSDIAKKHGVDQQKLLSQLKKGIKVELEHTTDRATAKEIALDHISEFPNYYDKLERVEASNRDTKSKK